MTTNEFTRDRSRAYISEYTGREVYFRTDNESALKRSKGILDAGHEAGPAHHVPSLNTIVFVSQFQRTRKENYIMSRLLETFILYLMLVVFAIYGVLYLAPRVGEKVRDHMIRAIEVK